MMKLATVLWRVLDGKKTYLGVLTTAIGILGMFLGQEWAAEAQATATTVVAQIEANWSAILAVAGLISSLVGGVHKDVKMTRFVADVKAGKVGRHD